jgi:cytochrome c2
MISKKRKAARVLMILAVATPASLAVWTADAWAGDAAAGKVVFETVCHTCHAALPYTGRIGEANLAAFLSNPRRYNPRTAMTFPGLKSRKDIDNVISYITGH